MNSTTYFLEFGESENVKLVKIKIGKQLNIPSDRQRLMYAEQILEDDCKLCDYNIQNQSTLHVTKS